MALLYGKLFNEGLKAWGKEPKKEKAKFKNTTYFIF